MSLLHSIPDVNGLFSSKSFLLFDLSPVGLLSVKKLNKWRVGPAGGGHASAVVMHIFSNKKIKLF